VTPAALQAGAGVKRAVHRSAQNLSTVAAAATPSAQHQQQLSTQAGQANGCSMIRCCWLTVWNRCSRMTHHLKQSSATTSKVSKSTQKCSR
jgi:hypothetical protein